MGWQPFSTAPRDGTPILAFAPDEDFAAFTGVDLIWFDHGWLYGQADAYPGRPTHWHAVPTPPARPAPRLAAALDAIAGGA